MGNVKTGNPGMACVKEFKTCIGKCISRIPESKQVFDGIVVFLDKTGNSLDHYFKAIVTREDGLKLKPSPDSILECLRRMEVDPAHALTVGDTPMDIQAGKAAGTFTIGVLTGIGNRQQLEAESPTAIIDGVAHILSVLNLA